MNKVFNMLSARELPSLTRFDPRKVHPVLSRPEKSPAEQQSLKVTAAEAGRATAFPASSTTTFAAPVAFSAPAGTTRFENIAFAGGGNRCFWQAGCCNVAAPQLNLQPRCVTAVNAGAAIACSLFSGGFDQGFRSFIQAVADNRSNLNILNLLHKRPLFPHGQMYRNAILSSITQAALDQLHVDRPEIFVLVACPPGWATPALALMLAAIANSVDSWLIDGVHSTVGRRAGFSPEFISIRECAMPEALADLIMASACVPPFTPQARRNGMALLDGGLVDNVPTDLFGEYPGKTLVLLSQHFRQLPTVAGRTYVQPSQPIPVAALDYIDDAGLQSTFDLGRRDAEAFCAALHEGNHVLSAA